VDTWKRLDVLHMVHIHYCLGSGQAEEHSAGDVPCSVHQPHSLTDPETAHSRVSRLGLAKYGGAPDRHRIGAEEGR
jgi:hypothetical protein